MISSLISSTRLRDYLLAPWNETTRVISYALSSQNNPRPSPNLHFPHLILSGLGGGEAGFRLVRKEREREDDDDDNDDRESTSLTSGTQVVPSHCNCVKSIPP